MLLVGCPSSEVVVGAVGTVLGAGLLTVVGVRSTSHFKAAPDGAASAALSGWNST